MSNLRRLKVWLCRLALALVILQIAFTCGFVLLPALESQLRQKSPLRSLVLKSADAVVDNGIPALPTIRNEYSLPNLTKVRRKEELFKCPQWTWEGSGGKFVLGEDTSTYFQRSGQATCAIHGTDAAQTTKDKCACKKGWNGDHCSVPDSVVFSSPRIPPRFVLKPRLNTRPRRIIQAFPFNVEFPMLEARLDEVGDIVDVFLILESNYTAFGHPRQLWLLQKLGNGYLKEYACKIVYVYLDYFPKEAYKNGWIVDNLLRNYIVTHGLAKQVSGYRHDDIFILNDADEIPKRETILFLKLHDGYPEPFGFHLQWNTFGFFWKPAKANTHITGGVTMGMLLHVYAKRAINIRTGEHFLKNDGAHDLNSYLMHEKNVSVYFWSFGNPEYQAGWHCSWCCDPACIQTKLISAQNGDFPRWGSFPEKTNIHYIISRIQTGVWFDNVTKLVSSNSTGINFTMPFFLKNRKKHLSLLENPYSKTSSTFNRGEFSTKRIPSVI